MKVAQVSKKYGISQDTLRYYEKIGLLSNIPRTKSGIREYDESSCKQIEFIKCMRAAGMQIAPLSEYMKLLSKGKDTVTQRKKLLEEQREILQKKKEEIENTLNRLDYKISLYEDIEKGKRKDFSE